MNTRFFMIATLLLAGAATYSPALASDNHPATIKAACSHMGLAEGTAPFAGCVATLERSLAEQQQAQLLTRSKQACASNGFAPGTPAYATCVVDTADAGGPSVRAAQSSGVR